MNELESGGGTHDEDVRMMEEPSREGTEMADVLQMDLEQPDRGDRDFDDDAQPGAMIVPGAEVGTEILTRLLELMGLEGDVLSELKGDTLVLNIEGDDLGVLIGRRGMTLSALQYVVRLMIAAREDEWPSIMIDVCGYKKRRYGALEDLARKLADQAKYRRRPMALEPMPPDERRVIHLALANHPDVYTESIGSEIERKIVIHPKGR